MTTSINQDDINKALWSACDTFRGVIDPSQYKDYILTMLFLKYVSDVSKAKYKEYLQRYDGDTERAQRAMRRERFQVPEKSSFDYLFEHRNEPNIGELIDVGLADLEYENREKLSSEDGSGIFRNISFNNHLAGIMLDRLSNHNLVAYNTTYGNGSDGIAMYESNDNILYANQVYDNADHGTMLAYDAAIAGRVIQIDGQQAYATG
mgnify:CR=1 FL=1